MSTSTRAPTSTAAQAIVLNAKLQRPGVCNALETLLVHRDVAAAFLPGVLGALTEAGVRLHGDQRVRDAAPAVSIEPASDEDWDQEYLALELAVGVVDSAQDAIAHINAHGSGHSEAIVTRDTQAARAFQLGRGCRLRVRQRLDAVHRRWRVRHGRGDRKLHPEAPRARPDRAA